jgi:hypothetical protein
LRGRKIREVRLRGEWEEREKKKDDRERVRSKEGGEDNRGWEK